MGARSDKPCPLCGNEEKGHRYYVENFDQPVCKRCAEYLRPTPTPGTDIPVDVVIVIVIIGLVILFFLVGYVH